MTELERDLKLEIAEALDLIDRAVRDPHSELEESARWCAMDAGTRLRAFAAAHPELETYVGTLVSHLHALSVLCQSLEQLRLAQRELAALYPSSPRSRATTRHADAVAGYASVVGWLLSEANELASNWRLATRPLRQPAGRPDWIAEIREEEPEIREEPETEGAR